MPRKNKTFSDKDVIRIIVKHLTPKERLEVALFMEENLLQIVEDNLEGINNILLDIIQIKDIIQPWLDGLAFIPGVGQIIDIVDILFNSIEEALKQTARE
jgi:hypothetical protein